MIHTGASNSTYFDPTHILGTLTPPSKCPAFYLPPSPRPVQPLGVFRGISPMVMTFHLFLSWILIARLTVIAATAICQGNTPHSPAQSLVPLTSMEDRVPPLS